MFVLFLCLKTKVTSKTQNFEQLSPCLATFLIQSLQPSTFFYKVLFFRYLSIKTHSSK